MRSLALETKARGPAIRAPADCISRGLRYLSPNGRTTAPQPFDGLRANGMPDFVYTLSDNKKPPSR